MRNLLSLGSARIAATTLVPLLLIAALAAGCSGKSGSLSPAAPTPSAQPAPPGSLSGGASISGTVVTGAGTASWRPAGTAPLTVTAMGTGMSTTIGSSGTFTLNNVPSGHVVLQFSGTGIQAQADLGDLAEHQTIRIIVTISGSTADVDESESEMPDNEAEVEGRVTSVNAGAGVLAVGSIDVTVPSGTTIRHGDTEMTLADIHLGDRVHVKGMRSGSAVVASDIQVQTANGNPAPGAPGDPEPGHGDDHGETELNGAIAALGGTCPSISFKVGGTTVKTDGSTEFKDSSCRSLANGRSVEVKGTRQSDNSVLAARVEAKNGHDD